MQDMTGNGEFDFDYWSEMARDNPEAFEVMRKDFLKAVIDGAPGRLKQRLRGLQWQIEQTRERADNPMSACLQVYRMMRKALVGQGGLLKALENPEKLLKQEISYDNIVQLGGQWKGPARGN